MYEFQTLTDRLRNSWFLWLTQYLFHYKYLLLFTILSTSMVAAGDILTPIFVRSFIDDILPSNNFNKLYEFILLLLGIYGIVLLASVLRVFLQREISERSCYLIQTRTLGHLRVLGIPYIENKSVGELFSVFNNDVSQVQRILRDLLPDVLYRSLFAIASLIFMSSIDPLLTCISIAVFLVFYSWGAKYDKMTNKLAKELHTIKTQFDKKVYSHIAGNKELKTFGSQSWNQKTIMRIQEQFNHLDLQKWFYIGARLVIRRLVISNGILIIFIYAGFQIMNNNITIGEISAYLVNYILFVGSFTHLITILIELRMLRNNVIALQSFFRLKKTEPLIRHQTYPISAPGEILLDSVSFSYTSTKSLINKTSLHLKKGGLVSIVGKNGSGKSTILKLIGGLYNVTEGRVIVDGTDIQNVPTDILRKKIGFVFQDTYLFNDSIFNNILFGKLEATREEVILAAKMANAHDFIMDLEQGYDTKVGERGTNLSGGQKQRICIARMLIRSPDVILMDEFTSALDTESEDEILRHLMQLRENHTIINVAHRLKIMRLSDTIVMMQNGQVMEVGNFDTLQHAGGAFSQLVNEKSENNENRSVVY